MGSIVQLLVHRERNCMFYALWVNKSLGNLSLVMLVLYESYSLFFFFFSLVLVVLMPLIWSFSASTSLDLVSMERKANEKGNKNFQTYNVEIMSSAFNLGLCISFIPFHPKLSFWSLHLCPKSWCHTCRIKDDIILLIWWRLGHVRFCKDESWAQYWSTQ